MQNVQIAICPLKEFLFSLPSCFMLGNDGKLHHKHDEIIVFADSNRIFADAYSGVIKVETMEEFTQAKKRLLTLPIYMKVHLERHVTRGRTTRVIHGDYVIMVNTTQADIKSQLFEAIYKAEKIMLDDKNFAFEIKFGKGLKQWYASVFHESDAEYHARGSSFCLTNFRRQIRYFKSSRCWEVLGLCCLLAAPIYFGYRAVASKDSDYKIYSSVVAVKGKLKPPPKPSEECRESVNSDQSRQPYHETVIPWHTSA